MRKKSPSVVSVVGDAQHACPATGTLGKLKSLCTEVHSLARADHITLPGVTDIQLHALPYKSVCYTISREG